MNSKSFVGATEDRRWIGIWNSGKKEGAGHRHDELPPFCVFGPLREPYFPFLSSRYNSSPKHRQFFRVSQREDLVDLLAGQAQLQRDLERAVQIY
jgi:hypothetical protein